MERVNFELSGMTCGHCVSSVAKALQGIDGVQIEKVAINRVTVGVDSGRTSSQAIAKRLGDVGYPVVATSAG